MTGGWMDRRADGRTVGRSVLAALLLLGAASLHAQAAPTYRVIAGAESDDQAALIEFTPCTGSRTPPACGARVTHTWEVGLYPADIEGPHGIVASHDGKSFYVSLAHGRPFGLLQRYDMATGRMTGEVELGMFPATVDIAPGSDIIYVINFNFDDPEMRPSSLSVVDGETMTELARIPTCRMPHGSRVNPQGTRHYSGCMMNDLLVEVDALELRVSRLFNVAPGHEGAVDPSVLAAPAAATGASMPAHDAHGDHTGLAMSNLCSPTWAQPSADGAKVYVACNKSNSIVEVDVKSWTMTRRWSTPRAPYNLAVTPDGRLLIATQKGPGSTSIWRLSDAKLLADVKDTRGVASGVAVSPDSRYAFTTLEGVGGQPGTVDVIDLDALARVATVDMGKQAGGIAVVP